MKIDNKTISMVDSMASRTITANIKLTGAWRIRLGCWIIKVGARISGVKEIKFE